MEYGVLEYGFDWRECDAGSLIVVDEAHWQWPAANFDYLAKCKTKSKQQREEEVAALSEHRHQGYDFILMSQSDWQLHWSVKGFVTRKEHMVQRRGTMTASNIVSMQEHFTYSADQRDADKVKWDHPKSLYGSYISASMHDRRKSPMLSSVKRYIWIIAGMVALILYLVWGGFSRQGIAFRLHGRCWLTQAIALSVKVPKAR